MSTKQTSSANARAPTASGKAAGLPKKKATSASTKADTGNTIESDLRVMSRVLPGGFRVYGSPLQPRHRSIQEIVEAVASLRRAS
jgi:hypothetical protein